MKIKYISWLPALIIMIIIFYFSSKPAIDSGESSLMISRHILTTYENITGISNDGLEEFHILSKLDHVVRKTAHFIEYMVLAAMWFLHFTIWKIGVKGRVGLSILITSLYAATDEYHQTFVAGRSGQISDVLLDSCGAATGAFVLLLIFTMIKKRQYKRSILSKRGSEPV